MRFISVLSGVMALAASLAVNAQDLLRNTGEATRSYNYIEAQYLLDMDTSPPVLATLVMDLTDAVSFRAEYLNTAFSVSDPETGIGLAGDVESLAVGLLYHQRWDALQNTDWVAGFLIGRGEIEASLSGLTEFQATLVGIQEKAAINYQEVYVGLRRSLFAGLEFEVGANFYRGDDGDIDPTADVRLVLRVLPSVDVALAGNELGDADIFGVGLRYTW